MNQDYIEKIFEISRRMSEIRKSDSLLEHVIDRVIDSVKAERGYIILTTGNGLLEVKVKRRAGEKMPAIDQERISMSVVNEVLATGQPVIVDDAVSDDRFSGATSVVGLKLRSIICTPLVTKNEPIGVIYLENRSFPNRFTEENLSTLTMVAKPAAAAIENATFIEELEGQINTCAHELGDIMSEIVEANQERTVWLSNMAHDLRAPLGIAVTALSLLQEGELGDLNEVQREWAGKSLSAIQHSNNLINDLFYLFILETGGVTLDTENVDLREFLQTTYSVAQGLLWAKGVTFELDMAPSLPHVSLDPLRIRQVLLNLLTNAQKFTPEGAVTLHAAPHEDGVLIGVRDTGEGIPAEKLDQLFQRFQQVDDNRYRRQKGTGLGLAICHELVEKHGGRIWVESTLGEGSNFVFSLPISDPQQ